MRITRQYDRYDFYTGEWTKVSKEYDGIEAELILAAEAHRDKVDKLYTKSSEELVDDGYVDHEHQLQRISGERV